MFLITNKSVGVVVEAHYDHKEDLDSTDSLMKIKYLLYS